MTALAFFAKHWQASLLVLVIVICAASLKAEHALLLRTRTELARQTALLAEAQALAKDQAQKAATVNAQAQTEHDLIQNQLQSALKAHALTADALTRSVRDYEDRRSAGTLSQGSGAAGRLPGHHGDAAGGGGDQHLADVIAAIPSTCQTVIDQLGACQAWAKSVRCGLPN